MNNIFQRVAQAMMQFDYSWDEIHRIDRQNISYWFSRYGRKTYDYDCILTEPLVCKADIYMYYIQWFM